MKIRNVNRAKDRVFRQPTRDTPSALHWSTSVFAAQSSTAYETLNLTCSSQLSPRLSKFSQLTSESIGIYTISLINNAKRYLLQCFDCQRENKSNYETCRRTEKSIWASHTNLFLKQLFIYMNNTSLSSAYVFCLLCNQ